MAPRRAAWRRARRACGIERARAAQRAALASASQGTSSAASAGNSSPERRLGGEQARHPGLARPRTARDRTPRWWSGRRPPRRAPSATACPPRPRPPGPHVVAQLAAASPAPPPPRPPRCPSATCGPASTSVPSQPCSLRSASSRRMAKTRFLCRKSVPRQSRNGRSPSRSAPRGGCGSGLEGGEPVIGAQQHHPGSRRLHELLAHRLRARVPREERHPVGGGERQPRQRAVLLPV